MFLCSANRKERLHYDHDPPQSKSHVVFVGPFRSFEEQLTTDGLPFFQETHLFASQEAQVETDPEEEFRHPSIPVELALDDKPRCRSLRMLIFWTALWTLFLCGGVHGLDDDMGLEEEDGTLRADG